MAVLEPISVRIRREHITPARERAVSAQASKQATHRHNLPAKCADAQVLVHDCSQDHAQDLDERKQRAYTRIVYTRHDGSGATWHCIAEYMECVALRHQILDRQPLTLSKSNVTLAIYPDRRARSDQSPKPSSCRDDANAFGSASTRRHSACVESEPAGNPWGAA